MGNTKYIFGMNDRFNGLTQYAFDTVKVLLEDKEFCDKNINLISQNDFSDLIVRNIICCIKDYYHTYHRCPSADTLIMLAKQRATSEFDEQEIDEFFNEIKSRELTDDRREEVKSTLVYLNTFACICRVMNKSKDGLGRGLESVGSLVKLGKEILKSAEELRLSMEQLSYNTAKTSGDWDSDE